ncbi:carboxymuconolactone decarboxylase [Arenibacter sp. N53]|uniref:carboxymuconolactone decarboxylase family protein n=1 Tax=Arenibacter TaxID=178469 RepID=UPI000CD3D507|nr:MULTISPECIES: carboxymuconolactone decarboxylase family protein [Arenibacter]MCM4153759.1 carboxymuconolactone decarboxylase [Arenibacter sp. N53]
MKQLKTIVLAVMTTAFLGLGNNADAQISADRLKHLSGKQHAIINISSLTAKGYLKNLETALVDGLEAGLTVNEIKEVIVHLYAYCGFPRSLQGLRTFIKVLDDRKAKGIEAKLGKEATRIDDSRPKYERGKENLEILVKRKLDGPPADYAQFAPVIEVFLKEHLFADIFERDVLDFRQRELVTVSVLATIGGVEPMLRSHLNICMVQGITPEQLEEFLSALEKNVELAKIESAKEVLKELMKPND